MYSIISFSLKPTTSILFEKISSLTDLEADGREDTMIMARGSSFLSKS